MRTRTQIKARLKELEDKLANDAGPGDSVAKAIAHVAFRTALVMGIEQLKWVLKINAAPKGGK